MEMNIVSICGAHSSNIMQKAENKLRKKQLEQILSFFLAMGSV